MIRKETPLPAGWMNWAELNAACVAAVREARRRQEVAAKPRDNRRRPGGGRKG